MTPRAAIIGWLLLLAFTFVVAAAGAGCGGRQIPDCPTPTATYEGGWCTGGKRDGKDFLFCTPVKSLCQYAVDRANAFNKVAKLGIETLSDCKWADVTMLVKEMPEE